MIAHALPEVEWIYIGKLQLCLIHYLASAMWTAFRWPWLNAWTKPWRRGAIASERVFQFTSPIYTRRSHCFRHHGFCSCLPDAMERDTMADTRGSSRGAMARRNGTCCCSNHSRSSLRTTAADYDEASQIQDHLGRAQFWPLS